MRRPICAACNRNVKVTSSSESTTAAAVALVSKSHSTANSSRRSSVSTTATTPSSKGHDGTNKKRTVARSKSSHTDHGAVAATPHLVSATSSLSTVGSHHSIHSMMSSSSSSSGSNHGNAHLPGGPTHRVLRSHSPTSPIPTRRRSKKKSTLISNPPTNTTEPCCSSAETTSTAIVVQRPSHQLIEKWSQLLSQQQRLLATLGGNTINAEEDEELNSIQHNITKLVTSNQEQYETVLLETQAKILQKFTLLMMQQQQQQQQRDALLFLSSSSTSAFGVSGSAASMTPINIYNTTSSPPPISSHHQDHVLPSSTLSAAASAASAVQSCNWQTKLEYGVTRFKWNMSQWIGSLVGTGDIEEQDFDALGYPQNVIISGICVTTEPGLLPKGLQKYFQPYQQPDQVICHKYMIHLTRASRLTKFQLLDPSEWVQDEHASKCQFQIQDNSTGHASSIKRIKYCHVEFGVFQRRHHCRSCGHVFCQEHSANKLPLFVSNGQDCGEWARVCDACFYSRIEPHLISRT
ncbi:hypothetical protein FB192DRAFT_1377627 [Mucor lusitanicus]|uniref:FYVE-type domain-containing protein n=1 Tax=Mucor circinelloides f. lusitanicus TaxID=29924 RepID=A0A8H4BIU6_MUCCL|nr:hypothetical protein FB192DRAFT_1377627 [Mucor lusitanicus]